MENATQYRVLYSVVVTFVGWQKKGFQAYFQWVSKLHGPQSIFTNWSYTVYLILAHRIL